MCVCMYVYVCVSVCLCVFVCMCVYRYLCIGACMFYEGMDEGNRPLVMMVGMVMKYVRCISMYFCVGVCMHHVCMCVSMYVGMYGC